MAETKVRIPVPPNMQMGDAWDIPIVSSTERWSEYELEDGTVIRAKVNAIRFVRVEGQYDNEGKPLYAMFAQNMQVISSVPNKLLRKVN